MPVTTGLAWDESSPAVAEEHPLGKGCVVGVDEAKPATPLLQGSPVDCMRSEGLFQLPPVASGFPSLLLPVLGERTQFSLQIPASWLYVLVLGEDHSFLSFYYRFIIPVSST